MNSSEGEVEIVEGQLKNILSTEAREMPRPVSSKLREIVNLPKDFRDEVLKCVNILYLCVKSNLFQLGKKFFVI